MCVTVTAHYINVGGQENSPNGVHSGYTYMSAGRYKYSMYGNEC